MSLRARLLTVVVSLTAIGLIVASVVTYQQLRSFLVDRVDHQAQGSAEAISQSIDRRRPGPGVLDAISAASAANPGLYVGSAANGTVQWGVTGSRAGDTQLPQPDLSASHASLAAAANRGPFTVGSVKGDTRYRVQVSPVGDDNTLLLVAAPLKDADATLHRLLIVELAVAASVLLAVLLLGLWLVRVGLRPLGRIENTAAAIAGGDLSQRVENDDPRTEVGRLGGALNTMLGQIEEAFDERTASENRLRRFIADASHELRTPLAAVRAYAELFDRGARERPDDLERSMNGIQRESRRMGLLVDDLLLLARLDQGRPLERKPVELEDVASDAVEAARMLDPGREIELDRAGVGRGAGRSRAAAADPRQPPCERARAHAARLSGHRPCAERWRRGGDRGGRCRPGSLGRAALACVRALLPRRQLALTRRGRRRARPRDHLGDRRVPRRLGNGRQRRP